MAVDQVKEDERVVEIETERLQSFQNHPFKVEADIQMVQLKESIEKYGIDCLKYCTVGEDFEESTNEDLCDAIEEIRFCTRSTMSKVGHIGLLGMAVYDYTKAKGEKRDMSVPKMLVTISMLLMVFDYTGIWKSTISEPKLLIK